MDGITSRLGDKESRVKFYHDYRTASIKYLIFSMTIGQGSSTLTISREWPSNSEKQWTWANWKKCCKEPHQTVGKSVERTFTTSWPKKLSDLWAHMHFYNFLLAFLNTLRSNRLYSKYYVPFRKLTLDITFILFQKIFPTKVTKYLNTEILDSFWVMISLMSDMKGCVKYDRNRWF